MAHGRREEAGARVNSTTLIVALSGEAQAALELFLTITLMAWSCQ